MSFWDFIPIIGPAVQSSKYANKARKEAEANQAVINKYRPGLLEALNKQVNDPYSPAVQSMYQTSTSATQRDLANATRNLAQNYGATGMGQSAVAAAALASTNRQAMDANRAAQTQRIVMSEQQRNQAIGQLLAALGNPNQLQDTYNQLSQQYGQQAAADIASLVSAIGTFGASGGKFGKGKTINPVQTDTYDFASQHNFDNRGY